MSCSKGALARAVLALLAAVSASSPAFAISQLSSASLSGSRGFRIELAGSVQTGRAVLGDFDFNGDGRDDLAISAPGASTNGAGSGAVYVVLGREGGFPGVFDPTVASDVIRLDGPAGEGVASALAAGDVNGDGVQDLVLGVPGASYYGNGSGAAYVVFGRTTPFPATLALASLDGTTGLRLDAENIYSALGRSVSTGDFNADGIDDVLVGAPYAPAGNPGAPGKAYVVLGHTGVFPATLRMTALDGTNGYRLEGAAPDGQQGVAVGTADANGDGIDDIVVSSSFWSPFTGRSFVLHGRTSPIPAAVNMPTGADLTLTGPSRAHSSVGSAGDFDGDGREDFFVSSDTASNGAAFSGSSYIVYGAASLPASMTVAAIDARTGFRIDGAVANDMTDGKGGIGDINGDGFSDFALGAPAVDGLGLNIGTAYIVFGRPLAGTPATLGVAALTGSNGFRIFGGVSEQLLGAAIHRAGDLNGDGLDDLVIGAPGSATSAAYVLYGNMAPMRSGNALQALASMPEDESDPPELLVDALSAWYVDTTPMAGVAVTGSSGGGRWQYASDATSVWLDLPGALSIERAFPLANDARLRFVPDADYHGAPELELRLWDGADNYTTQSIQSIAASVGGLGGFANDANLIRLSSPVVPVNDAPSFAASDPPSARNDIGAIEVAAWATFEPGPANEATQTALEYLVGSVSNAALFASAPVVVADGGTARLRYTPAAGATGTSTIEVRVRDSGGTADGGVDTSAPQTFTITVFTPPSQLFGDGFE